MVILLIILIPIVMALTSYVVLKAYTLGLKHNVEVRQGITPQEPKTIIQEVKEHISERNAEAYTQQINQTISEYLNGGA